ncbi:hypothetical protein HD553DRAFT_69813 [Filobasidium floriforme]|uniref:uncharacterized protein n=1 Tax=Filobasidium floriforme TaxID=5210 RepID=UPI001E8EE12F|nr:uncharacterized protein HD553DRAFT_69813 [Filobasidium floriforme]KAH8082293.1 hypothetical protein HD553DRAFT_69813 [Filobasidium floriforme]
MDFEQLFDSFPLAPFAPEGGLGGGAYLQPQKGQDENVVRDEQERMDGTTRMTTMNSVMTLENANEIAAAAFELAEMRNDGEGQGLFGMTSVDVRNDDDNKMNKDQMILGGEGKMEDYSAFFNFGNAQEEPDVAPPAPAPVDESFDLRALLGDANGEFSQAALASAVTSLYTSFSTPAVVPWSTQTQLCSDFEDIEQASPDMVLGQMFPDQTGVAGTTKPAMSAPTTALGRFDSFGSEPAFDDVDGSALTEQGMFSLPLFGGMPSGAAAQAQSEKATATTTGGGDDFGPLSPSHAMRLAGTVSPQDATLDMFAANYAGGHYGNLSEPISQTASPRNLFLPTPSAIPPHMTRKTSDGQSSSPPSPLIEVEQDFSRDAQSGKSRKPSLTGSNNKTKKKPYAGPTGTRKSSRPLLDADAPTMTKTYAAPGSTTRKLIPAGFQKKLKLQSDVTGDAVLPESMGEDVQQGLLDEIEEKRRRNCVAARESRKRKADYQNGLKDECRGWRSWAEEVQAKLKAIGLEHVLEDVGAIIPAPMDLDE